MSVDEEVLAILRGTSEPVLSTSDVADKLGVSRQRADQRLRRLLDAGEIERKRVGPAVAWYLPDD